VFVNTEKTTGNNKAQWGVYTIQQTFSKLPANVFKTHVLMLDVCWIVWTPYKTHSVKKLLNKKHKVPKVSTSFVNKCYCCNTLYFKKKI